MGRDRLVRQLAQGHATARLAAADRISRGSRPDGRLVSQDLPDKASVSTSRPSNSALDTKHSVSAVIACYKDNQAIPIMYERLKSDFTKLNVDYEIIFVNDCSPDDSEEVIRDISRNDRRVIGISHSRNFGSQAAFRQRHADRHQELRASCSTAICRIRPN